MVRSTNLISISNNRESGYTEASREHQNWGSRCEALAALGQRAISGQSRETLLDDVISLIREELDSDFCSFSGPQVVGDKVTFSFGAKFALQGSLHGAAVTTGSYPFKYSIEKNQPIAIDDLASDTSLSEMKLLYESGVRSLICAPIPCAQGVCGTLAAYSLLPNRFLEMDLDFLEGLAIVLGTSSGHEKLELEIRHLSVALDRNPESVVITDGCGVVEYVNQPFLDASMRRRDEVVGQNSATLRASVIGGEEYVQISSEVRSGQTWTSELLHGGPDGEQRWELLSVSPIWNLEGEITHLLESSGDISRQKRADQLRDNLLAELDHRNKNLLATVHSLAQQTARNSCDLAEFQTAFSGRVLALSAVHSLLTKNGWKGVLLSDLLSAAVNPYSTLETAQVRYEGPRIRLGNEAAEALFLAFHELAVNARRYGALSRPEGILDIVWEVRPLQEGNEVFFTWSESGLTGILAPLKKGFGSELITRTIHFQLDGSTVFQFQDTGLLCTIKWRSEGKTAFSSSTFEVGKI